MRLPLRSRLFVLYLITALAALALTALSASAQAGQPNATYLRALAAAPARPLVHYQLDLTRPGTHLAAVTLTAPATGAATTIEMPVWYPGRYSIYHFPASVQQTGAWCAASGAPLPYSRPTPHSWLVANGACATIRWSYRVYGRLPLNGTFFQLDNAHANLNGGALFMYVAGEKPNPVSLSIQLPAGWHVLNELGRLDQTELWFPNYDIFIDAPTEAAPRIKLDQFKRDGTTYRVLIHDFITPQDNGANRARLLADLKKIAGEENAIIGPDDLDTYTFFFHFDQGSQDGMEHLFGTQIMVESGLATSAGLWGAESDAAHEFFHQWNVKRMRPLALGPWDYEAENPTPSLWFAEGFTQYYGEITLERTGLQSSADYLRALGANLGDSLTQPGYRWMSAEDASTTAWFHDATPLVQRNNLASSAISYYERGDQLAATLDLDLRARSGGRRSLNDVMRWLWQHTYRAPRATYYLPGRGYTDADVEQAVEAVAGASYQQFFADYVSGTQPIPYDHYLAVVGLELRCTVPPGSVNYTGAHTSGNNVGRVDPGSPADTAGLGPNALITAVDGKSVAADTDSLGALPPGRAARLEFEEDGAASSATLVPQPPRATACTLQDTPTATPRERALQEAWLGPAR